MSGNKFIATLRHHHESRMVAKRVKQYKARASYYYTEPTARSKGVWRKHSPFNCGRSGCMMCVNPRRTWNQVTLAEVKADISYAEQLTS